MAKVILAGIFSLAASTSLAQTAAPEQAGAGGPANLCQELVAFMREAPPAEAPATAAAQAPAAPAADQPASAQTQPAEQGTSERTRADLAGGEGAAPASGEAVPPQPLEETQSAQEASGQTGPAHGAPEPNTQAAEAGKAQNAELTSSLSAPMPTDGTATARGAVLSLAEVEELARANDIAACQDAGRDLRLAGVAMPPPLLALTALDLQYHRTGEPQQPQAPDPGAPAAEQPEAPQTGTD
jgi:hypothetical protein